MRSVCALKRDKTILNRTRVTRLSSRQHQRIVLRIKTAHRHFRRLLATSTAPDAQAVLIEGHFVVNFNISQILFSHKFFNFHIFQFVFPNIGMLLVRVPNILPSVKFPKFWKCFLFFLISLFFIGRQTWKIWKNVVREERA